MDLEEKVDEKLQKMVEESQGWLISEVREIIKEIQEECYPQFIHRGVNDFVIYRDGDAGETILSTALLNLNNQYRYYRGFEIQCRLTRESDSSKNIKYGLKFGFDPL